MILTISNEAPFQILSSSFSIGPSETGYDLQVGADSRDFTTLFSVGANTPRMVTNVANGSYYRLKNNVGEVKVNWQRVCVDEGGSGGSGGTTYTAGDYIDLTGDVISVTGITPDAYLTSADTEDFATEQYVQEAISGIDLSNYWTSAQTQSAITEVEDHLFDVEQVTASALTELHVGLLEVSGDVQTISAATSGKADAVSVSANTGDYVFPIWNEQGIITGKKETVQPGQFNVNGSTLKHLFGTNNIAINIYTPTTTGNTGQISVLTQPYKAEWVTPITINGSAITAGGNVYAPVSAGTAGEILVSAGHGAPVWSAVTIPDTSLFVTSAQVETQIESALEDIELPISTAINNLHTQAENFITSADTANYVTSGQVEAQIVGKHYTTSAQTATQIASATTNMVQSTTIRNMVSLSQSAYDALSTKDPNTFYIITGTTS